jgi:hypothetical protein
MGDAPQHGIRGKNLAHCARTGNEMARFSAVFSYGRLTKGQMRIKMGAMRAVRKNRNYKWVAGASPFQSQLNERAINDLAIHLQGV